MSESASELDPELLGVSWKDEQWLQQWALTADNVLAYFAHSQAHASS
jgi:hypothetical protein